MLRGLFTSASGMLVEALKTDVVTNNLANAQTHGFKRQSMSIRSFPEMLLHRINDPVGSGHTKRDPRPVVGYLGAGAAIDELALEMTPGAIRYTGRQLDLAIEGPGFLSVLTPDGEVAYTRDGNLRVDENGFLVTQTGLAALGEAGPILVGDTQPAIDDEGRVWIGGEEVAALTLWEFPEPRALGRLGDNLLVPSEGSGAPVLSAATGVRRGHLEEANVNVVAEMVNLITIQRAYEANQKILGAQDETLGRLINDAAILA